jgi:cofilin
MGANTGVIVSQQVVDQFGEFKLSKNKTTFIIFKIVDKKEIVTDFISGEGEVYQTFLDKLPENECRFAIYSFGFTTKDGRAMNKMVSISWIPDKAKVQEKMLYAGSKDALGRVLVGVSTRINATDTSELTEEIVLEACRKFT